MLGELWSIGGRWPFFLAAACLPLLGTLVGAVRWRILLTAQGICTRLSTLYEAILVGTFYNQLLPSTIGGDLARSWWAANSRQLAKETQSTHPIHILHLTVVGLDRLLGLFSIFITAMLAAVMSPDVVLRIAPVRPILAIVSVIFFSAFLLSFLSLPAARRWIFSGHAFGRVRASVRAIYHALLLYRKRKLYLVGSLGLSLVLQVLIIIEYWMLATALGLDPSLRSLSVLIPIVTLVSLAPFAINGIGLRENLLAWLGGFVGLSVTNSIALAWAFLIVAFLYACLGGIVHLRGVRR